MAFSSKDLSVLAYANGFTLWHYTTVDLAADVYTSGYFDTATDMVRVSDMVLAHVDTDGTPASGSGLTVSVKVRVSVALSAEVPRLLSKPASVTNTVMVTVPC